MLNYELYPFRFELMSLYFLIIYFVGWGRYSCTMMFMPVEVKVLPAGVSKHPSSTMWLLEITLRSPGSFTH